MNLTKFSNQLHYFIYIFVVCDLKVNEFKK